MNDDNVGNALAKNNHELLCDYDICALFFIVFHEKKNPYNKIKIDISVEFLKLVFIDIYLAIFESLTMIVSSIGLFWSI
jgi:hypothetical protein